jgi:hypothetical protein
MDVSGRTDAQDLLAATAQMPIRHGEFAAQCSQIGRAPGSTPEQIVEIGDNVLTAMRTWSSFARGRREAQDQRMDQLLFHAMGRLWIDDRLRPPSRSTDGCGMKPQEAPAACGRRTPSLGRIRHGQDPSCQPVEIRLERVRGQRNRAPMAWPFGPHMQPVTWATGHDLALVETDATADRRWLIADSEQSQQHVRRELEATDTGRLFTNVPESQPLQFDLRKAGVKFAAPGHDEMDIAGIPQGRFEVICLAENRHHAGRHCPPVRFGLCTPTLRVGCYQSSVGAEL